MRSPGSEITAGPIPLQPQSAGDARATATVSVLGLCLVVLAAIAWLVFSYGYIEDDAFIHLEFARSLVHGHGFAFNGKVVNGDTAPLWPLLLAGIHSLGFDWVASAKLACAVGLLAAVCGVWRLASDLAADDFEQRWLPPASVLVTVVNPFFVHWSFSGMESVAAVGLSLWVIWLVFVGQPRPVRLAVAAVLIGIGPLLRPELLLLGAIAGFALLWRCWQRRHRNSSARRLGMTALLAVVMVLPLAIWSGYALETFGALIPTTNVAKRGGSLHELAPRMLSVYLLGFPITLALLPFVLPGTLRPRVPGAVRVLLLWPLICGAFYLLDHTAVQTRYCLLSMPSLSIAVLWLVAQTRRPLMFRSSVAAMTLAGIAVIALIVVPHVANKVSYSRALSATAAYMKSQLPPQAAVAIFAIGQIAFESEHPLVDVGGITDPSVIPYIGNAAATLKWAKAHGAQYYITGGSPEPGAVRVFSSSAPFIGWTLHRSQYSTQHLLQMYKLP